LDYVSNSLTEPLDIDAVLALCRLVVGRYVTRNVIPDRDAQDVEMAVIEKYLMKKDKIMQAFGGRSSLRTYLIAVLNRMCCEIIRSDSRHWYSVRSEEHVGLEVCDDNYTDTSLLIRSEVKQLEQLLRNMKSDGAKTQLMACYYYHLPIKAEDIESWAPGSSEKIIGLLQRDDKTSKGELFVRLALAVNHVENKNIKPDAVRMWFNKQMNILLQGLNGNKMACHTRETLVLLIERLPPVSVSFVHSIIVFLFIIDLMPKL
jgi:DNA-directed RNA polymerase specialized sigma24 family protein